MKYTVQIDGMEEISEMLNELEKQAPAIAAQALYEGANEVAQAILKEMGSIKTAPFSYAKTGEKRLPSPEEKEVLMQAGVGIAKFDVNGSEVNTSIGIDQSEYADVNWNHMSHTARTNYKAYAFKGHAENGSSFLRKVGINKRGLQNRKPVGAIANAINSGTSFMQKQPFVKKGAKAGTQKASVTMKAFIENALEKLTK